MKANIRKGVLNKMKKNVLVFMTDQQRGDSLFRAKMPNADRLMKNGVTFANTFTVSPHCCPARASFFSGLYPSEHGVWNNVHVDNTISRDLFDTVTLFPKVLKENGYNCYFSGKWHVSAVQNPDDLGCEILGITSEADMTREDIFKAPHGKRWDRYKPADVDATQYPGYYDHTAPAKERGRGQILRPGYGTYTHYKTSPSKTDDAQMVDVAIAKLDSIKDGTDPWCMYIGVLGPHDPYFVPQHFIDLYNIDEIQLPSSFGDAMKDKPAFYRRTRDRFDQLTEAEHKEAILYYLAYCSYVDSLFGKVLDTLEANGQMQDTVIIFTSDHGDYMAEHGIWAKGLPCFDSGYQIPLVISHPDFKKDIIADQFVSITDLAPTVYELAGIKDVPNTTGVSLVPFLEGKVPDDWRDTLYTQSNGNELFGIQRSVKTDKWKLVFNGFDYDEFYDMENDPDQITNLIADRKDKDQYGDVIYELYKKLWTFGYAHKDNCISEYIMTGLAEYGPGLAF